MRVDLFDFELPRELIAARPEDPRDSSRLLRIGEQGLDDRRFADLPELLTPGDMLVFNDTRVIPVRLAGRRGGFASGPIACSPPPGAATATTRSPPSST